MLTSMRNAFATGFWRWVLIVMMSLLILSFAVWGINDIFRGFGRERVGTVGSTEITVERFRNEFDRERQNLSRRAGQAITNEQARAFGMPEQILQRLVTEAALDERAKQLTLGVSDAELARLIVEDPNFTGGGAAFNRDFFIRVLQANNMSEAAYVASRRALTLRLQIVQGLAGGMGAPGAYDEILHRFQNEKRTLRYLTLPADRFAAVEPPSEEVLTSYFNLVSAAFRSPETREVDVLLLTPQAIAQRIEVSDADARAVYDQNTARFGTPERREVWQLVFNDQAAADAAAAKLAAGTTWEALAEELLQAPTQYNLGKLTRAEIIDPAVRDAVFALPAGANTGAVQGRFGWVVLRAQTVEAGNTLPFEAVMDQVKRELALERGRRQVFDVHDRVEEERLGGVRLPDIAQKLGLPMVSIPSIDRSGRDTAGAPIPLPGGQTAVNAIFAAQPGGDNDSVQLRELGGYIWVDVKTVTRERDRALADVREQVVQRWMDEQRRSKLSTEAARLIERLQGGVALDALATELGLEMQTTQAFGRTDAVPGLSRTGIAEAFRIAADGYGTAPAENDTDRVLFQVASVEVPTFEPGTTQSVLPQLSSQFENDVIAQYVNRLERDLGTTINRDAVNRVVSPTGG